MKLKNSPTLEQSLTEGTQPVDTTARKRTVNLIIKALLCLLVVLLIGAFSQSAITMNFKRKGTISGSAVDENNLPLMVELIIPDTKIKAKSNENGMFEISGVPVGEHLVIVAHDVIAVQVNATVIAGAETPLGIITVPTNMDIE